MNTRLVCIAFCAFAVLVSAIDPTTMPGGQLPHFKVNPLNFSDSSFYVADLTNSPTKTVSGGKVNFSSLGAISSDVILVPEGSTLVLDQNTITVSRIGVKGSLIFSPSISITLKLDTIFVYETGILEIMPSDSVTHTVIFSGSIDTTEDPNQWGLGLVTIGGTVTIVGRQINTPFVKIAQANDGDNYILVEQAPSGWRAGDEVFLVSVDAEFANKNDGLFMTPRHQRIAITSVDGTRINLASNLVGTYNTMKMTISSNEGFDGTYYRPYENGMLGYVTRNVVFKSEEPDTLMKRGHLALQLMTNATIKYAAFEEMGRTTNELLADTSRDANRNVITVGANHRGRYALHMHHLRAPFELTGNVVYTPSGNLRWGMTMHDCMGTIEKNIVVFHGGAGIATELSTEYGTITNNIVFGVGGGTGLIDPTGGRVGAKYDFGHGGMGYWIAGVSIVFTNNLADGFFAGSAFSMYLAWYGRANFEPIAHQYDIYPYIEGLPLAGEPAYLWQPFTTWDGQINYAITPRAASFGDVVNTADNVITNLRSYHGGIHVHGHTGVIRIKDFMLKNDGPIVGWGEYQGDYYWADNCETLGYYGIVSDYDGRHIHLQDGYIANFFYGAEVTASLTMENVTFKDIKTLYNIRAGGTNLYPSILHLEDVQITYADPTKALLPNNPSPKTYLDEPASRMEITWPRYGDFIPNRDIITARVELSNPSAVVSVKFTLDGQVVGTSTSNPHSIDLPAPLSMKPHDLKVEATTTDGAVIVIPTHVFYSVPSTEFAFEKGFNLNGPTVTWEGKTFDGTVDSPLPGEHSLVTVNPNLNSVNNADDVLFLLLKEGYGTPLIQSGSQSRIEFESLPYGVYQIFLHNTMTLPLSSGLVNYVNDEAVVFANGKLDSNEYTRIGPLVAYIDADQTTVSVGQRILHEGTEVILGAVEFHRAQLPPPGTEPSAPYQILPSPDGTKPATPGSTVASGSRLTTSVMLFALVVALIM